MPQQQDLPLEQALVRLIRHFGAHSRNATRAVLSLPASAADHATLVDGPPAVE
ncbi:hypothetical protein D3C78_1911410 [compost metagenome]